jgi:hypothetical protein
MKIVIVLLMVGVLAALASAGMLMLRKDSASDPKGRRMARALAVRVGLSVALFALLMFAYWMGWIQPTGIPLTR